MINDHLTIASEIRELENLLAVIPEGNVIERMSLESRLESAKAALATLPQQRAPKARLTFRGKPVFGSHGIAADFWRQGSRRLFGCVRGRRRRFE